MLLYLCLLKLFEQIEWILLLKALCKSPWCCENELMGRQTRPCSPHTSLVAFKDFVKVSISSE